MHHSETISINLDRLDYKMALYGIRKEDLLTKLSLSQEQKASIENLSFLKNSMVNLALLRIINNSFFQAHLSYFIDSHPSGNLLDHAVFRIPSKHGELDLNDRWQVNKIEEELALQQNLIILADYPIPTYSFSTHKVSDCAKQAGLKLRKDLSLDKVAIKCDKGFLVRVVNILAKRGILVYEYIENQSINKQTKVIGMSLKPNIIVIQRRQKSLKNEIFTLAQQLGQLLLQKESISIVDDYSCVPDQQEQWSHTFAFYFLAGNVTNQISKQLMADKTIADIKIDAYSQKLHLSKLAIYTHLAIVQKLSWKSKVFLAKELENNLQQTYHKATPAVALKPIQSAITTDLYRHAYFNGTIEEIDIINKFKVSIKAAKNGYIDKFLYQTY